MSTTTNSTEAIAKKITQLGPQSEHVMSIIDVVKDNLSPREVFDLDKTWTEHWKANEGNAWREGWGSAFGAACDAGWDMEVEDARDIYNSIQVWVEETLIMIYGFAPHARDAIGDAIVALVARDFIGRYGFSQEDYNSLVLPWTEIVGKVHPDDTEIS